MADLANSGKPWTDKEGAAAGVASSVTTLSAEFKRTEAAIRDKRQEMTRRARGQVSRYAVRRDSPLAA
jgi:hypothetical protein